MDRRWHRGLRKSKARVDLRIKEIAPDNRLRKWFTMIPKNWVNKTVVLKAGIKS